MPQKHCRQRARFNWVAQRRTRAMCLEHCLLTRLQARIRKRRVEHALLRLPIGSRQARASPILTDRAANHPCIRVHSLAALSRATCDSIDRLTTRVTVSTRVKCVRTALDRREACDRVASHRCWLEDHIDTGAQ